MVIPPIEGHCEGVPKSTAEENGKASLCGGISEDVAAASSEFSTPREAMIDQVGGAISPLESREGKPGDSAKGNVGTSSCGITPSSATGISLI